MSHPALFPTYFTHEAGHLVPEAWDDMDRGLCPCGEAVSWDGPTETWRPDRTLRALVLTKDEIRTVRARLREAGFRAQIDLQLGIQEEFE